MNGELVEISTTVASEAEGVEMVRTLVEERLVACGNVLHCRSVYFWEGRVQDEPECVVLLKTRAARAATEERRLAELHPYSTPAILRLPVLAANRDYVAWVAATTTPQRPRGQAE